MNTNRFMTYQSDRILADLNPQHHVSLVLHAETGKICIRKQLEVYNRNVYHQLKSVSIPGTPRIFSLRESDENLIVYEEFISGMTLRESILDTPPDRQKILRYLCELCEILSTLHSLTPPIIHRDLKPSNLMISDQGHVILIDFNAAKNFSPDSCEDTQLLGTRGYAAPEQYGFGASSPKTDIYGAGVILKDLCAQDPQLEAFFRPVILKATQLDPDARYESADEMKAALLELAASVCDSGLFAEGSRNYSNAANPEAEAHNDASTVKHHKPFVLRAYALPGFRSGKPFNKLFAGVTYAFFLYMFLAMEIKNSPPASHPSQRAFLIVLFLTLVCVPFNYMGLHRLAPFRSSPNKFIRWFGVLILTMVLASTEVVFYVFFYSFMFHV